MPRHSPLERRALLGNHGDGIGNTTDPITRRFDFKIENIVFSFTFYRGEERKLFYYAARGLGK